MAINLSDFNDLTTKGNLFEVRRDVFDRIDSMERKLDRAIDLIRSLLGDEPYYLKEFLSPVEVSQLLGVHSSTVRRWVKDPAHDLKGFQPEGKTCAILIRRADLESYLGQSLSDFEPKK